MLEMGVWSRLTSSRTAAVSAASQVSLANGFTVLRSMTTVGTLGLGAASGLVASSICFPLDTVRRQMQMRTCAYTSQWDAMSSVLRKVACPVVSLPWALQVSHQCTLPTMGCMHCRTKVN